MSGDKLDCDNWDNGVYIIEGWKIVDRQYNRGGEQNSYELREMLNEINLKQPKDEQLDEEKLDEVCKRRKAESEEA